MIIRKDSSSSANRIFTSQTFFLKILKYWAQPQTAKQNFSLQKGDRGVISLRDVFPKYVKQLVLDYVDHGRRPKPNQKGDQDEDVFRHPLPFSADVLYHGLPDDGAYPVRLGLLPCPSTLRAFYFAPRLLGQDDFIHLGRQRHSYLHKVALAPMLGIRFDFRLS